MAPQRPALAEKSVNRVPGGELTPNQRGIIEGMKLMGASRQEIARRVGCAESTVRTTLRRAKSRDNGKSLPRSGRPKVYDERDERRILRVIQSNPKIKHADLLKQAGVNCSWSTLKRLIARAKAQKPGDSGGVHHENKLAGQQNAARPRSAK